MKDTDVNKNGPALTLVDLPLTDFKEAVKRKGVVISDVRSRLLDYQADLLEKIQDMKQQIRRSQIEFNTTGERADPIWYDKVHVALHASMGTLRKVQAKVAYLKQYSKELNVAQTEESFIKAARMILDPDLFARVMVLAVELKTQGAAPEGGNTRYKEK